MYFYILSLGMLISNANINPVQVSQGKRYIMNSATRTSAAIAQTVPSATQTTNTIMDSMKAVNIGSFASSFFNTVMYLVVAAVALAEIAYCYENKQSKECEQIIANMYRNLYIMQGIVVGVCITYTIFMFTSGK